MLENFKQGGIYDIRSLKGTWITATIFMLYSAIKLLIYYGFFINSNLDSTLIFVIIIQLTGAFIVGFLSGAILNYIWRRFIW